jgi:lysozyme family protein
MSEDEGFDAQIARTLEFEGGYVSDPRDAGGETKYGISKASYPNTNIADLTIDQAKAIYFRDYWLRPGLRKLPAPIGAKVFDLGVNMGTVRAIKLLQASLNALGADPELAEDGIVGLRTQTAAQGFLAEDVIDELRSRAAQHYQSIVSLHPAMRVFLRGWLRRAQA